jgi:hypothetical protein
MAKETFRYVLKDVDGKQMLFRFHVGPDGKPTGPSVLFALPVDPSDGGMTITGAEISNIVEQD